ncbi:hypothetical protein [Methanoculleus chikugoensis]|uniref:hypothetical protein n=1 Tax=Methanoculleus chikugoensis TaxID=118126 RepID=UPI001FB3887D|nr:hypothetical protein [Methanoculleus chikugoensis]
MNGTYAFTDRNVYRIGGEVVEFGIVNCGDEPWGSAAHSRGGLITGSRTHPDVRRAIAPAARGSHSRWRMCSGCDVLPRPRRELDGAVEYYKLVGYCRGERKPRTSV